MTTQTKRETRVYTAKGKINIHLMTVSYDSETMLVLGWMESSNKKENERFGDDGDLQAWDAEVTIRDGVMTIIGADGPSGGRHSRIHISVPMKNVAKMTFEIG